MASSKKPSSTSAPSDLELQILSVLWRRGASTARELLTELPDGKARAYTTVLSMMQVMQKKGLLDVGSRRGLANVYHPLVSRRQVLKPMMKGMVKKVFGGSPSAAVAQLLDADSINSDELDEIARMVKDAVATRRKGEAKK